MELFCNTFPGGPLKIKVCSPDVRFAFIHCVAFERPLTRFNDRVREGEREVLFFFMYKRLTKQVRWEKKRKKRRNDVQRLVGKENLFVVLFNT